MFRPRSVAVVGASQNPSFVSGIFKNLLRYSYEGTVSAINPRYESILGAPCYGSVLDVPGPLDLVVIGVASRLIPTVLEQCEEKDVGAVEIVSSGFSEMGGAEGAQRQAELAGWARRTGIPVGGPNCLGLMNMTIGMMALPTTLERLIPGKVGAVLQSGMMAPSIIVPLLAREIGFTIGVTTGNEVDLEAADYVRYCVEDDETRVIACYTEQIKTPAKFIAACTLAAERNKPVIMLKIGRSEIAQRSALAHTGSLVGADDVTDAVLRKLGVIRVDTVDDLYEAVAIFHTRKLPRGGGVVPVSVSGGAGGLLADLAQEIGVEFPPLPQQTAEALRTIVPEYGNVGNPLDITGQGVFETDMVRAAFDQLATAGNLDIVVWARSFPSNLDRQSPVGQILEQAVEKYPEIVFLVMALVSGHFYPQVYPDQPLAEPINHLDGIPFLQGSESGLKAIAALIRYAEWQRERAAGMAPPPGPLHYSYHGAPDPHGIAMERGGRTEVGEQARALVLAAGGRALTERESKAILALYGIRTTREILAADSEHAVAAAAEIGYPVALKAESPELLHKTEAGAILLNVADEDGVRRGFKRVLTNAWSAVPAFSVNGVLVQEMIPSGTEMIVGMSRDAQFGPVIACGLGGIFVETLKDVQLLLPPLSDAEVRQALARLRGYPLLQGTRGSGPADLDALVDVLLRFSELCRDLGDIVQEIDVNPLIVAEAGGGACAVDCLIVPKT
jgi:acetate---CoA ligase (ADP-forming)